MYDSRLLLALAFGWLCAALTRAIARWSAPKPLPTAPPGCVLVGTVVRRVGQREFVVFAASIDGEFYEEMAVPLGQPASGQLARALLARHAELKRDG